MFLTYYEKNLLHVRTSYCHKNDLQKRLTNVNNIIEKHFSIHKGIYTNGAYKSNIGHRQHGGSEWNEHMVEYFCNATHSS